MKLDGRIRASLAAVALIVGASGTVVATQLLAHALGYQRALGQPVARAGDVPIYAPAALLRWEKEFRDQAPAQFELPERVLLISGAAAVGLMALAARRVSPPDEPLVDSREAGFGEDA
jgi:hypothetical protein